ncbi:MAG: hypothetical protein J07HQW2_02937 [Haloquadratum walsbyi J07HQW2]|uniref:Uncharacterized protein n=1 Tax=Haloquadratum walsbyi J07HQW2 TaxID=1238425 RepID=U1NHV7_9EURY|nr:MAG: hypothetical protein J07HQW2_02937 [Haloquadratum walsbyi J07HQW2]
MAGGRALDRVDELHDHEVRGWFRSEQDVNVVVLSVEGRQFDAVVVREPADNPANDLIWVRAVVRYPNEQPLRLRGSAAVSLSEQMITALYPPTILRSLRSIR